MQRILPIIIRPQEAASRSVNDLAEEIIQGSLQTESLNVIGIGSAIPFACSTIAIATELAKIYLRKIVIDVVEEPISGSLEIIYFSLTTEPTTELEQRVATLDAELTSVKPGSSGQVIFVSKAFETRHTTMTCLYKMKEFNLIKLAAAGAAISQAVSAALQVVKLSKEPVRIEAASIQRIEDKEKGRPSTALSIYVRRGTGERDPDLRRMLRDLKAVE